ncbi:hypothetical protein [Akkermansia biwaensis]
MNEQLEIIPLNVSAKGEVLSSNLAEFRASVKTVLDSINRTPKTDEEFGLAEQNVKMLKGAEDTVKAAKEKALKDAESLHQFFSALDESSEEIRQARLALEKKIAAEKEKIRTSLINEALDRLECVSRLRKKEFGGVMTDAIKGKRTLKSIKDAIDAAVSLTNNTITENRQTIREFIDAGFGNLVMDEDELETKSTIYVESELRRRQDVARVAKERARLAEEARKALEEAARAKAELEEHGKPPVPPSPAAINMTAFEPEPEPVQAKAPVPSPAPVGEEEWRQFQATVFEVFGQLKEARGKLTHPANKRRVAYFAQAVNNAWKACETEGGEK